MDVFLLAFLCRCTFLSKSFIINLAEGVGFEPTDPCGSPVFKTGAIDHSAIPPISAPKLNSLAFYLLFTTPNQPCCCQNLVNMRSTTHGRADSCEYSRTKATGITSITSMGSRSTESEGVFFSQAKRKPKRN